MSDLELIGAPHSNFVRAVRIACEEKGVPYTLTPARPHSPEVDAIHPLGKIPVMKHGTFALFESRAIVSYVDRVFPGPRLFPEDARACALVEQWVSIANTAIIPKATQYLQGYFFPRTDDGRPNRAAIEASWPEVRAHMDLLDETVKATGHLVGNQFTYADMNLVPVLAYLRQCPESKAAFGETGALGEYFEAHSQRASVKATEPPPFPELTARR